METQSFYITTLEDLKKWIVEEWDALPQDIISRAISLFREGFCMVIKKNVGHIEKDGQVIFLFISTIALL